MTNCPYCNQEESLAPPTPSARKSLLHRAWKGTHWLVPSLLLAFIPKCPMCIVAYVALFTGLGISLTAAHWIQISLWALCLFSFAYLVLTRFPLFQRSR